MGQYVIRRVALAIPMLFSLTVAAFMIIQAPPGDFLTKHSAQEGTSNEQNDYYLYKG